jgi:hypothetical protein
VAGAVVLWLSGLWGVGPGAQRPAEVTTDDLVHVHDLLVAPGGAPIWVAAHTGLYRYDDGGLERVSDHFDDLMAATVEPDGTLIASGHPDLAGDRLRVEGEPPLLGLVASRDGEQWEPRSLLGQADFHALVALDGVVYGADSTAGRVRVSRDGGTTWDTRGGEVQLLDLAVDPADPAVMVGSDLDGRLVRTTDGAATWTPLDAAPVDHLVWTPEALVGLASDGRVLRSADQGTTWQEVAVVGAADALASDGADLYAFVPPATVLVSRDHGTTWQALP